LSLKRLTQPATEPVSLAEIRSALAIQPSDTSSDATITRRITEAREWAENHMQRAVSSSNWRLSLDEFPDAIRLPMAPVSSVISLSYTDTAGTVQTLNSSLYGLDSGSDSDAWILPAYQTTWPETADHANSVVVEYTAGWTTPPAQIKEAIILIVIQLMQFQGAQASGYAPTIPRAALQRLDQFRVLEI
jgi:uncharacterized phiE125 gp8 family phage protein